jgi:WXXGXW repeat (2 copies)
MSSIATRRRVLALGLPLVAALCVGNIAQAAPLIDITIAPPAPRHEDMPSARAGFTWAPGYWRWDGHAHVWEAGHWEKDHPGHHWVPAVWTSAGGHYHFVEGHWD